MVNLEENDLIFHKAIAEQIKNRLEPIIQRILKSCEKLITELKLAEVNLENAESLELINKYSKLYNKIKDNLIKILAVKNRLTTIVTRNKKRLEYINKKLNEIGIYNQNINKKDIQALEQDSEFEVTDNTLNLNFNISENIDYSTSHKFFKGELLAFKNDVLDFSLSENMAVLESCSMEFLEQIIKMYPESMSTITEDVVFNPKIKKKILKGIAAYVVDNSGISLKDINKKLGNLLSFTSEIPNNLEGYIAGVKNMFNVMAKGKLLIKNPEMLDTINKKLKCNEKSELIPASKKVALLANGISGDVEKSEEQESEEVRLESEKELQTALEALDQLITLNEEEQGTIEEKVEQEKKDEEKIIINQEHDRLEDEQKLKKAERELEEYERMLEKEFVKHDD